MADPRFYDNRGPFTVAEICARLGMRAEAGGNQPVMDVASIDAAGRLQLTYCAGKDAIKLLNSSRAGVCLIDADAEVNSMMSARSVLLRCDSAAQAFSRVARMFYPDCGLQTWDQSCAVDPLSRIAEGVHLAPGVVIGPRAEIGPGTRIGPNAAVGRGVCVGANCEIGGNVTITNSYIGDNVTILPGAQVGQPGFGFSSGASGHLKIPQLGRVIIQDRVEIGACTTIDRGALGDTIIGEGTKIDNLVQIGHNCHIGRHCIIVGQVGISGSSQLGDFVVLGGQVGLADHVKIGDGARLAARSAMAPGELAGGQDYGGAPARPIQQWRRELATIALLSRRPKRSSKKS